MVFSDRKKRQVVMSIRFQIKQIIKQAVQSAVLPVCYQSSRGGAVDPQLVVFADAHHNSRPAAMELLYQRLRKDGSWTIVEHYLDYGTAGAAQVAKHSMQFMKLYAKAGFIVICDNFLPVASCQKREETKVIQLWHACGSYKKFGYDAKDDIPEGYHGANVYRNASLVTVSGEAAVGPFSSAMRQEDGIVQAMGVSRTDLYFSKKWRERCVERFYREYPEARGKKVVLWAPTFRGNAGMPVEVPLNLGSLQEALGEDFFVLVKLHPHMQKVSSDQSETDSKRELEKSDRSALKENEGRRPVYNCSLPTEELYPIVDVLIADYSSLIYEYLLFGKSVVLYVPDLEQYRAERGFYMDISEIPGEIVTEEAELSGTVMRAVEHPAGATGLSYIKDVTSSELPNASEVITEYGSRRISKSGSTNGRISIYEGPSDFMKRYDSSDCMKRYDSSDSMKHYDSSDFMKHYDSSDFMIRYMGACDGHATERIAEWMRLQKQGI